MIHGDRERRGTLWRTLARNVTQRIFTTLDREPRWPTSVTRGFVLVSIASLALPAWGGDWDLRAARSSLARTVQDEQFIRQQSHLVQGLAAAEQAHRLTQQSYIQLMPPRRFELRSESSALDSRPQQYRDELDRLSFQYRVLEEQRRRREQIRPHRLHQPIAD